MGECVRMKNEDFEPFGITLGPGTVFQRRNLLIGKNGAGKTRFLRARMQSLKERKNENTIPVFLDFSSFYISGTQKLPYDIGRNSNIYDLIFYDVPIDYSNFLNIIDYGNESMIEDLRVQLQMNAPASRKQADDTLQELNKLLNGLMGCSISYENQKPVIEKIDERGNVVRQKRYSEMIGEFSPGERIIFDICFFVFYLKVVKKKKIILLMDEPELHLHPQALMKVMAWLYDSPVVEELWVASHSLFLVPMFQFQELVLVDSNRIVSRNSDTYQMIYDELVGIKNINVFEFLKSLDNWQYYNFLVECFSHPEAVSKVNPNDEQFQKFITALKTKDRAMSRVLDYGAGKFRIWDCIQEAKTIGENVDAIRYEAYEPYLSAEMEGKLEAKQVHFPLYTQVTQIPSNSYDAVVLMNVLHEIDIFEWLNTFRNIKRILKPDGVLILLEVRTLLLGEQPYGNTGYLVLGNEEVYRLFPKDKVVDCGLDGGKSNCWVITNEGLGQVSKERIKVCISELRDNSLKLLREEFEKKMRLAHSGEARNAKEISARSYAFWSQQYINAELALERFTVKGYSPLHEERKGNSAGKSEKIDFPGLRDEVTVL